MRDYDVRLWIILCRVPNSIFVCFLPSRGIGQVAGPGLFPAFLFSKRHFFLLTDSKSSGGFQR